MTNTPKRWVRLGLGAALTATVGLSACGGEAGGAGEAGENAEAAIHTDAGEAGEAAYSGEGEGGEMGEGEGGDGAIAVETAEGIRILSVEKRVAFMSGHVEAGLALYRAGVPEQAARHLQHPVSETHASERAGIDALGFDQAVFQKVSAALADGTPAGEVESLLTEAEANIDLLQRNAGGDPVDLILFLMDVCVEEYQAGVLEAGIRNLGEYQDAYGFAVAARNYASRIEDRDTGALMLELELLVRMWPSEGPVETEAVAPFAMIASQAARVKLELSTLE